MISVRILLKKTRDADGHKYLDRHAPRKKDMSREKNKCMYKQKF